MRDLLVFQPLVSRGEKMGTKIFSQSEMNNEMRRHLCRRLRPQTESYRVMWNREFGQFETYFVEDGHRSQMTTSKLEKFPRQHKRLRRSSLMIDNSWSLFYRNLDGAVKKHYDTGPQEFCALITEIGREDDVEIRYRLLWEKLKPVYIEMILIGYNSNDLKAQRISNDRL